MMQFPTNSLIAIEGMGFLSATKICRLMEPVSLRVFSLTCLKR